MYVCVRACVCVLVCVAPMLRLHQLFYQRSQECILGKCSQYNSGIFSDDRPNNLCHDVGAFLLTLIRRLQHFPTIAFHITLLNTHMCVFILLDYTGKEDLLLSLSMFECARRHTSTEID